MSIFKSIKETVINSTLSVVDTTRGIASITVDAITDNKATQAISKAKAIGHANRREAQAKALAKKLIKPQKKQDDLRTQADNDF